MNSKTQKTDKIRNSFIEKMRRKQILEVAIDAIAKKGYRNISLKDIAITAGVSKGLLYYHFESKHELVGDIWIELLDELFEYRKNYIEAQDSANEKVHGFIKSHFDFLRDNANKFIALFEIGLDMRSKGKINPWAPAINDRCITYLAATLRYAQETGEFGNFSPEKLAPVIQGAIDGIALLWFSDPEGIKLDDCERELHRIVKLVTSKSLS